MITKFHTDTIPMPAGLCWRCTRKHPDAATCAAFPLGIPDRFLTGADEHRRPVSGDNDLQFDEDPAVRAILDRHIAGA